jgi:2-oxoglutarate dehydrogenase E1 component
VYYDLVAKRAEVGSQRDIAIVRLEQPYPWPGEQLKTVLDRYKSAREWVWVQEESQNMGAWTFVSPRLPLMGQPFQYVGRDASASPATGSKLVHDREQAEIVDAAIGGAAVPHLVSATSSRPRAAVPARPGVS